ncbi:SET domain protein, putative [Plasmodium knowlesi strain H]|uniref:SET domain protein, putative n=3 Tax=Plasmodium knowlesi TaxID=5850 RepID=A0A5K1VNW6_PLAKH|nr:SET domain protein, putative [Plasmodium knowlesi strain H]OTN67265.1 putative SET domain protein [Plasmodium knowlesi]CAA9987370.1 SET domain protein, putative [Plasmodium knowlesi strain H]SBO23339.1 SET domain protein, putative [Plasmodium knowlesi strain H]SBO24459.1 SET domain protein, putative [Plasmodium knowlesi strain H]VVS76844.1 SET domain protein, putative [Plasmodium knowlesi strain H]|eukprot:XP_002258373.1 hypothetical protein, conserved in Plasmodium species [Plasmodium knowlesi strain H]
MADNPNEVEFCCRVIKWQGKNNECKNNQRNERSPKVWLDYYNDVVRDDLKDIKVNTLFNVKRDMLTKRVYPKNKNSALLLHNPFDFSLKKKHNRNEGKSNSGVKSAHCNVSTERKKKIFFEDFVWNNELKRYVKLERIDGRQHKKHGEHAMQSGAPRQGANCGKSIRRSNSCMGLDNRAGPINNQTNGASQQKYTCLSGACALATYQQKNGFAEIPEPPVEESNVRRCFYPGGAQKEYSNGHPGATPNGYPNDHPNGYPNDHPNGYPNDHPNGYPNDHPNGYPHERHRVDPIAARSAGRLDDRSADPSAFLAAYQRGYEGAEPRTYTSSNYNAAVATYPNAPTTDVAHRISEELKTMILEKSQALKNDTMRNNHGENILMVQDEKTGRAKIVANKRIEIGQVIFIEECVLETSILLENLWDTFYSLDNDQKTKLDKICEYMNMGKENRRGTHMHTGVSPRVAEEELPKLVSILTDGSEHTTGKGGGNRTRLISYCRSAENENEKCKRRIAHGTLTGSNFQDGGEEKKKKKSTKGNFVNDLIKFETFTDILKNSFISPKDKTKIMLFQYASLLNHSCFPNASYSYIDINRICFISMRTINRYEEITISLIDELYASIHHRRSKLNEVKNGTCFCNRCSQIIDEERHILCPLCKYSYVRKEIDLKSLKNGYHNGGTNATHLGDASEPSSVGTFQGGVIQTRQTPTQVISTGEKVGTPLGESLPGYTRPTQKKIHLEREEAKISYFSSQSVVEDTRYYSGTANKSEDIITKKNMTKMEKDSEEPSMRSISRTDKAELSKDIQKKMPNARILPWEEDINNRNKVPGVKFNILKFEQSLNIGNILMLIWNTQNERNEIGYCKFQNNEELWICDTCGEEVSSCALPVESEKNFTKEYTVLREIINNYQFDSEYSVDNILNTIERSLVYIIGILGEKHWLYASFNYLMADLCFSLCCYSSDESNWDRYLLKGFNSFQNFLWFIQTRSPHSIHTDLVPLVLKFFLVCIYTCNYKTLYEFARSGFLELIRQKYGPWNIPFICLHLSFEMCYAHINCTLPICREILLVLANMTRVRLFGNLPRS